MFKSSNSSGMRNDISGILVLVGVIWVIFLLDRFLPLEQLGLVPRTLGGLAGIISMPVLHQDLGHIMGNTVPLIVLGVLLAGARAKSATVIAGIWLLTGVGLWLAGRSALHIGASGLVFGLVTFLIVSGFLEKRFVPLAISVLVGFLYGGTLLTGVLPLSSAVSWDGHLAGAVAGVVMAYATRTRKIGTSWG